MDIQLYFKSEDERIHKLKEASALRVIFSQRKEFMTTAF